MCCYARVRGRGGWPCAVKVGEGIWYEASHFVLASLIELLGFCELLILGAQVDASHNRHRVHLICTGGWDVVREGRGK